ncbi:MAG: Rrf2 family transcriptional regulator [Candidatus Omnitrophica bacterium]|nr:Rrf2 family transcriptional regulator [Candidatus Omnitrophota bacterium]
MHLLARSTDYAVRALLYMAPKRGEVVSTSDLDRDLKLPRPFMRRILQVLQKQGYLSSVKGHKGGFRLLMAPGKIRLIDLMRAFQGEISLGDCLFKKKVCGCVKTCPLRHEIKDLESVVLGRLSNITISRLMQGAS